MAAMEFFGLVLDFQGIRSLLIFENQRHGASACTQGSPRDDHHFDPSPGQIFIGLVVEPNPFEKYACQFGTFPQVRDENKNI